MYPSPACRIPRMLHVIPTRIYNINAIRTCLVYNSRCVFNASLFTVCHDNVRIQCQPPVGYNSNSNHLPHPTGTKNNEPFQFRTQLLFDVTDCASHAATARVHASALLLVIAFSCLWYETCFYCSDICKATLR